MFDPTEIVLNGVQLMALVFGLVEFIKSVVPAVKGNVAQAVTVGLGVGLFLLFKAVPEMEPGAGLWVSYVIEAVAFSLAASGFYKYAQAKLG